MITRKREPYKPTAATQKRRRYATGNRESFITRRSKPKRPGAGELDTGAGQFPASEWNGGGAAYALTCPETSLVISNIDTLFLPPKITFKVSSALI